MRRGALCAALLVCLALAGTGPAAAQVSKPGSTPAISRTLPGKPTGPNALVAPKRDDVPPEGRSLTARRVGALADAREEVRRERREYPGSTREVLLKGSAQWQVSYYAKTPVGSPRKEIAQVLVDDASGEVLEAWTDYKVAWSMARGYPGAFGRIVNAPWVWIPLALLFVAPFLRRPRRMLHLDLLVLSAFSLSLALFNAAHIAASVPTVYPLLGYLLVRMLWIGVHRRGHEAEEARRPLALLVPVSWLAIAVIFLVGFRVALNVSDSNVIDVGYAGVIGADKIADGSKLYGAFPKDNENGDTYGPVVYEVYMPFEQAWGWSGSWDKLPAAHIAAIVFDLLACLLCFLVGRRVRGPDMGIVFAYAWASYPFTLYAQMSNANDALVAVLVLAAIWTAGSAPARGAFVALAGLTKFAPLALAPLLACYPRPRLRTILWFGLGFAVAALIAAAPLVAHNDLRSFWDATIAFQAERGSPFSLWGLYEPKWVDTAQRAVQIGGVVLALALAFIPRRTDLVGLAACAAAIVIALQLGVTHWFYLYIPWFFPLVIIALLGRWGAPERA